MGAMLRSFNLIKSMNWLFSPIIIIFLTMAFLTKVSYAIDISNCQPINESGVYYLTADVSDAPDTCFEIQTSNVTLDCQGHVIDGNFTGYGIYINAYDYGNISNITIRNCTVREFGVGIYILSFDTNVSKNTRGEYLNILYNFRVGILTEKSYNISIFNSILQNNGNVYLSYTPSFYIPYKGGIYAYLTNYSYWQNIIVVNNSDDGVDLEKSFYFTFYNISIQDNIDTGLDIDEGCFHNFSLIDILNSGWLDIYLSISDPKFCNNSFYDVNASNRQVLYYANLVSLNHTLDSYNLSYLILCNVSNSSFYNIHSEEGSNLIYYSNNLSFYNSIVSNAYYGFYIKNGSFLIFKNTTILNSKYSYKLYDVDSSIFYNSFMTYNYYGIYFSYSNNNLIYNNFFNNTNNIYAYYSTNYFNTTLAKGPNIVNRPFIAGNVWAKPDGTGFSETCQDANHDGICDSSYDTGYGIDYAPLALSATYPLDPKIYVGNQLAWSYDGLYNTKQTINITNALKSYVSSQCSSFPCSVPITVEARSRGMLSLGNLNFTFIIPSNISYRVIVDNILLKDADITNITIISKDMKQICSSNLTAPQKILRGMLKIFKIPCPNIPCSDLGDVLVETTCGIKAKLSEIWRENIAKIFKCRFVRIS